MSHMTYFTWGFLAATYMFGGYGIYGALFEMAGAGGRVLGRAARAVCLFGTAGILISAALFTSWYCTIA